MKQNYFELFQLPVSFDLDVADLNQRHRSIIARVHPDQFAHKSTMEQRIALQWATFANEALDTLKAPVSRARYLLQLHAPELANPDARTPLSGAFLMQQMQWREALEDGEADTVRAEVESAYAQGLASLNAHGATQNWGAMAQALAEFQFIENFLGQLPKV